MGCRKARRRQVKMKHINPVEAYDVYLFRKPSNWVEKLAIHSVTAALIRYGLLYLFTLKLPEIILQRSLTCVCVLFGIKILCFTHDYLLLFHTTYECKYHGRMADNNMMLMYKKRNGSEEPQKGGENLHWNLIAWNFHSPFTVPIVQVLFRSRENSCQIFSMNVNGEEWKWWDDSGSGYGKNGES